MKHSEALEYIHSTYKFGSKLGLHNINYLLDLMGNPHENLKVIHVAGTNGKGSTSNYIATVLKEAGYKVGLFTSPYLEEFEERIRINGENIPKDRLGQVTSKVKDCVDKMLEAGESHPTEFEVVTAIGFEYFKEEDADFVVLEVGMGGRLDSTNVVKKPLVSVITPIALDHTNFLGNTIEKIAFEKAGIIKAECPVVSYPQEVGAIQVIKDICTEKNSKLYEVHVDKVNIKETNEYGQIFDFLGYEDIHIKMLGAHQCNNAVVAIEVLEILNRDYKFNIDKKHIYEGLKKSVWPGRIEILKNDPTIIIDGAHNYHGIKSLSNLIRNNFKDKNIILGLGILGDKDVEPMVSEIAPLASKIVITEPNNPRRMKAEDLGEIVKKYCSHIYIEKDIKDAAKKVMDISDKEDIILFAGSLYMIGEVRSLLK
ncbi:MAG: bifunctional folylpolyglutamate synthase/dihydrofolate synthase [Anaeromicrobium sp.]|jgi:dihydrofolate synthase/folylpolyglutamate synthase|uniref:bifunctional folylpolyglutamate synthase/dihydrofolate synthase n=1 Tax=Anaeromicrobium sp. TaxID=1929132 RepID=UPI0025F4C3A5|nr:folylpolyglutamate synthase/dihydrofolate synthase family protein [Anaeromicrobium sp.]MCT4594171.1 bifunctional folylpolyglutamate synthase/dihydrofolate synthase [Anaeromicrobium sp.]